MITKAENRLVFHYDAEELWIEPWGKNSLRIRSTKQCQMPENDWALQHVEDTASEILFTNTGAIIKNGKIRAELSNLGKLIIYNQKNEVLLEEYWRDRKNFHDPKCSAIEVEAREFRPNEIEEAYASVTGTVPMMPEYGLGFWQCKLRYQTQEEVLEIAREYKKRNLPIDLIVIDFFHWSRQGEWKFDLSYWPEPSKMVQELKNMGIELMVSVWPTVERKSENYYKNGIKVFWLDEAEPEYSAYDFDNYRYYLGTDLEIGNIYPREYSRTFYEGMKAEGETQIVNLVRCAWAGSQKYGALVWSGDIASSFSSMRNQLAAGLSMGLAGIPWWTTDIGGFHGGNPDNPEFRELFVRWFQWGIFCPVMRLHGDREPRMPEEKTVGGEACRSGAPNEVWSYGEEVYRICQKYLQIREEMRDYTRTLMREAHEKGTPVMRTLFYEFPEDKEAWEVEDEYLYGNKLLVAPILEAGAKVRNIYLPGTATCLMRRQCWARSTHTSYGE